MQTQKTGSFSLKNLSFFFILCLSLLLVSGSCSKDDDAGSAQPSNEVKVTINGDLWVGSIGSVAKSGNIRQINAFKSSDNTSLQLFFLVDTTGTFDLATASGFTVSYNEDNAFWSDNFEGTFTLDQNTEQLISGSFSTETASAFNSDTLSMTNGEFYWKF